MSGKTYSIFFRHFTVLSFCFLFLLCEAQQVFPGGGAGSYNLSFPPGPYVFPNAPPPTTPPLVSHYQLPGDDETRSGTTTPSLRNPASRMSPGYTGPFPTHKFWTSVIWNFEDLSQVDYNTIMYPHPFAFGVQNTGFSIMYEYTPQINVTDYFYQQQYRHLGIALAGMSLPATSGVILKSFGDWSATIEWNDGAGRVLEATVSRGSPYVFCKKSGANLLYSCLASGCSIAATSLTDPFADAYLVEMFMPPAMGNKYYGIFVPKGTTRVGNEFIFPAGQDYFSVAALSDNNLSTLNEFASHAFAFITDTKVSWSYDDATAKVHSTFNFTIQPQGLTTETNTLIALYRHQWKNALTLPYTTYTYQSPRGEMKVYEGNSFTTSITNHGVLPSLPDAGNYDYTRLDNYLAVYNAAPSLPANVGPYTGGLAMSRYCGLIDIAHQRGNYALRDALRTRVKEYLESWFSAPNGKSDEMFYYDANWTVLLAYPSAFESDRQMNDQHFHYGYFIKAAATVAQYEPDATWVNQWGPMVEMLIKNCANWDRTDLRFPFLRCHDAYAGHAWASGFSGGLKGNNQESSSEALNFTSAVMLWGINTGNTAIRDLGIFLHTTEVEATRQYWFDEDNAVFPAGYDRMVAGQVWGWGVEYRTWFGPAVTPWNGVHPQEIHGIQLIPFTGGHLYTGLNPAYAAANYAEMVANNGGPESRWLETFWMYQSLFDSDAASAKFDAQEGTYIPKDGESKAHTYHWIHNLDSMGAVDGSVTADVPTYAVFTKGDCKHYVVYNPPGFAEGNPYAGAKSVHFSDGQSFFVPEDTLIVFLHCYDPLPVQLLNFEAKKWKDRYSLLEWTTVTELNSDYFEVQRSKDGLHWEKIGEVDAVGNSSTVLNYSYTDMDPYSGVNYYRLKQVDADAAGQYSEVRTVTFVSQQTIKVFVDAPDKKIDLYISNPGEETEVKVVLYDVLGRVQKEFSKELAKGMNRVVMDTSYLSPGMYLVRVESGQVHVEKVVVGDF